MKKVLLILLILILLLGGAFALVWFKVIKIPGFDPAKLMGKGIAAYGTDASKMPDPKADAAKKPEPKKAPPKPRPVPKPTPTIIQPKVDPVKGAEKLAGVWSALETEQLLPIAEEYKDAELVPVLVQMDEEKVSALLAAMKPDRAARLSRLVQRAASIVEVTP